MTKKILVPTDFGESAELALDQAIDLARLTDGRIILLYACALPNISPFESGLAPTPDVFQIVQDAGTRGLAKSISKREKCGVEIEPLMVLGDARSAILDTVQTKKVDLIVMGTHGRSGMARLFLGSTAEAIVRTSPVPVLTVRAPDQAATSAGAAHPKGA